PDPMWVLANSTDGDKKARALRELHEPKQNGGSDTEQDQVVQVLVTFATKDRQPLCRLAAIYTLGSFKDPRAEQALEEAYRLAGSFNPETATIIRVKALESLGETGNP